VTFIFACNAFDFSGYDINKKKFTTHNSLLAIIVIGNPVMYTVTVVNYIKNECDSLLITNVNDSTIHPVITEFKL
jgi:hypothetical protein